MIRFFAAVLLLTFSTAVQADLLLDETMSVESSNFLPPTPQFLVSSSNATVSKAAPLGTFDQDFSAMDSDMLWSVTWRAPAGQRIEVAAPAGWSDPRLAIRFIGGSFGVTAGRFLETSPSISFSGFVGTPLSPTGSMSLTGPDALDSGASFFASGDAPLTPGTVLSFESVTVSATVPASYTGVFDNVPISSYLVEGIANNGSSDPGQWVRLVAVPEPSAFACLGLIGLFAVGRSWWKRR